LCTLKDTEFSVCCLYLLHAGLATQNPVSLPYSLPQWCRECEWSVDECRAFRKQGWQAKKFLNLHVIVGTSLGSTPTVCTVLHKRSSMYVLHKEKRISEKEGKNILGENSMLRAKNSLKKR